VGVNVGPQLIGQTFESVLPAARHTLTVILCVMYVFICLGVQIFGGRINLDPASPYSR
jgi:hypothetical protein